MTYNIRWHEEAINDLKKSTGKHKERLINRSFLWAKTDLVNINHLAEVG